MYRPTYIQIDGNTLENNVKNIVSAYPKYNYYFGIVKNNAYHHGIYAIKYMIAGGVNYLAVSSLEEALEARKYNLEIPILVLEPIDSEFVFDALANNITLTVGSIDEAKSIAGNNYKDDLKVHLKVDSGMNRLGFKDAAQLKEAYDLLSDCNHVLVEGIYTHLATSGIQDPVYKMQVDNFLSITSGLDLKKIPIVHVDRSLTFTHHDKLEFVNGIRMGIAMYGYSQNISKGSFLSKFRRKRNQHKYQISDVKLESKIKVNFAISVYSKVIELRKVSKGEFCGYAQEYIFKNDSLVATIPVGYADGVTKDFGTVYINNKAYKIIAECMDMIMVEVDDKVEVGSAVEIVGKNQSIRDIGQRIGKSGYKTLSVFTTRIPVVYTYDNETFEIKY